MPIYSDINQVSPIKTSLVYDIDAIYQSITNILSTRKNTRLFLPEFGSELENLLFEPMDRVTVARLYDFVIVAIERWEPRVNLDYSRSSITPNYDQHVYDVVLTFQINGLEDRNYYVFGGVLQKLS